MKKLAIMFLVGTFISSSGVYAYANERSVYPDDLQINIRNLGTDDCKLVQSTLYEGHLYQSQIPMILPADAQRYYFTVSGETMVDVALTYQCGDYKKATLRMKQYYKPYHHHTNIECYLTDAVDLFEEHDSHVTLHNSFEEWPESGHRYPGKLSISLTQ